MSALELNSPSLMGAIKADPDALIKQLDEWADVCGDSFWFKKAGDRKRVTLVAHIDTVWDRPKPRKWNGNAEPSTKRVFFDKEQGVIWSPDGLGADDRAGVFGLLWIWNRLPEPERPHLLFCDYEESGGIGAREATNKILSDLQEATLCFIELDRKGANDAVFYNNEPKAFVEVFEKFGFKNANGSFSDISILGRETELCAANLSVGYYGQHTTGEYLYVNELFRNLNRTILLLTEFHSQDKTWENPKPKFVAISRWHPQFGHLQEEEDVAYRDYAGRDWRDPVFWSDTAPPYRGRTDLLNRFDKVYESEQGNEKDPPRVAGFTANKGIHPSDERAKGKKKKGKASNKTNPYYPERGGW